jgi:hypothetical protein
MLQKSIQILIPGRKILSGHLHDETPGKENRDDFDLQRGNPIDEKLNFLNRTDGPILTFSLFTAALSLFLFILFLSEQL